MYKTPSDSAVQGDSPAAQKAQEAFMAMQTWPHWNEIGRGAEKEYGMSKEEFTHVLPEYQRFLALLVAFPGLGMLGERVDIVWHSHILNTIRYREFCEAYIGRFVNHLPCSSYELYGFSPICEEPPATCTDPWPAPPDPSPVPDDVKSDQAEMHDSILSASPHFMTAYSETFHCTPPIEYWPRTALVDGFAQ